MQEKRLNTFTQLEDIIDSYTIQNLFDKEKNV